MDAQGNAVNERYPVGPQPEPGEVPGLARVQAVAALGRLPDELRAAVTGLSDAKLDTPYRDGGWTVRQVVHHVADSHMNAYSRVKLALTEERPLIRPYDEAAWATLPDSALPLDASLTLLDGLHARWVSLLDGLTEAQWARSFVHPESQQLFSVAQATVLYEWHGQHHTAHIRRLRQARAW